MGPSPGVEVTRGGGRPRRCVRPCGTRTLRGADRAGRGGGAVGSVLARAGASLIYGVLRDSVKQFSAFAGQTQTSALLLL